MAVKRFENIVLDRARMVRLDNGMLRVPARLTRVGVFLYQRPNGSIERALRPAEEVFAPESVASFQDVTLTNDHPTAADKCAVTAGNFKKLAVGDVRDPKPAGTFLEATLMVRDAKAIEDVLSGKQELSCGYYCDRDETPGVWEGQPYDFVQRNIRGNHVAIVRHGRAGPEARIHLDASDAVLIDETPTEGKHMEKIQHDGLDIEVSETAKQAFLKERATAAAILDATKAEAAKAQAEIDTLKATIDSSTAKVTELETAVKELPAKIKAELVARVALETKVKGILGAEFACDGLDQVALKRAVVGKLTALKCDDKSETYVDAAFEIALSEHEKKNPATEAVAAEQRGQTVKPTVNDSGAKTAKQAREEMLAAFFKPSKK